jgi:hypothetical protein
MISWLQVVYGVVLTGLLTALLLWLASRWSPLAVLDGGAAGRLVILAGAGSSAAGALAWNSVLQATAGRQFFHDLPFILFPVSWQDAGSGVFALALAATVLGLGPLASAPARRATSLALLCGLGALLTDTYLY